MVDAINKLFPEKVRLSLYLGVALALMVFVAVQGADGNVWEAVGGFLVALQAVLAASKVSTAPDAPVESTGTP